MSRIPKPPRRLTPFQLWAALPDGARPKQPPLPTDKEWRNFVRDFRRLGALHAESRKDIQRLEDECATARKEANRLERELEATVMSSVDDAGWLRLNDVAREARGTRAGRAIEDWLEDWAPAWARLP